MASWDSKARKISRNRKSKEKRKQKRFGLLHFEALEPRRVLVGSIPFVEEVLLSSTAWTDSFLDRLELEGLGGDQGYSVDLGGTNALPWTNLNQLTVQFDRDVGVQASDLLAQSVSFGVDVD